ncbi:hypothetical protein BpHYR1_024933 [Brachionus plicatilis]|uniref:Uncharacterized protein n=1 Tax=Brachionus plicatilis TaxID=10195 RepID=A0A3M7SHM5_BRAPC|nr:hypothetical protein BpHYR1_024933 [Brachionus plicatilis]
MNFQAENDQTRSTASIAQFLDALDEDPEEPRFNYVRSLMNHETLDAKSNAKKAKEGLKRMWRAIGNESKNVFRKKIETLQCVTQKDYKFN